MIGLVGASNFKTHVLKPGLSSPQDAVAMKAHRTPAYGVEGAGRAFLSTQRLAILCALKGKLVIIRGLVVPQGFKMLDFAK